MCNMEKKAVDTRLNNHLISFFLLPKLRFVSVVLEHLPYRVGLPLIKVNNKIRILLANRILNGITKDNKKNIETETCYVQSKIGSTVWMFWYSGFDSAPSLVKKCMARVASIKGINLITISKSNLDKYFLDKKRLEMILARLNEGHITIQHFSDILRCYLLAEYGGFWLDATILVQDPSFFKRYKDQTFFSLTFKDSLFFAGGRWATFLMAAGKNNPVFISSYKLWCSYLERYTKAFDYFQTDHIFLYLYDNNPYVRIQFDSLKKYHEVDDVWEMAKIRDKEISHNSFAELLKKNTIQKLNYKDKRTQNALLNPRSVYGRLDKELELGECWLKDMY